MFDPINVHDNEWLYRSVKPLDVFITPKKRLTSAAFKDAKGTSVQRDGQRPEDEIVNVLKGKFPDNIAIVKIYTKICRDIGTVVEAIHNRSNIYHAEIHESETIVEISSFKLSLLAKNAEIVRIY